jgi:hypothetical protein
MPAAFSWLHVTSTVRFTIIALSELSLAASSSRPQRPASTTALDVPELGAQALRDAREARCLPTSPDLRAEPLLPEPLCAVVSIQKVSFHWT